MEVVLGDPTLIMTFWPCSQVATDSGDEVVRIIRNKNRSVCAAVLHFSPSEVSWLCK